MTPCGTCVRAEFADEDAEDLAYIAKRGSMTAHIRRPAGSEGFGSWYSLARRVAREANGPQTYCGHPIGADWTPVDVLA